MKMKKIVSLMLALVMMMPVFTGGSINAFATDETSSNTVVETSEPSNPMTVLKNILSDLLRGFDYTSSSGISEDTAQNSTTAMLNLLPEGTTMESAVVTSEAFGKNAVFKNTSVNLYQTLTYNAQGVHITVEPGTEIILGDTYTFKTDAGTFVFYQYSASGIQVTSDDLENYWRDFCYVYSEDVSILSDPVQTEKTDEATAITVSAVIPPEATMTVTPISLADSGLNTDEISVYGTPLFYRVTFMYLGKEYLPENGITVVIPETAIDTIDLKPGDYYKVYEIADDSTEVSEPLVYTDGCITKEFSGLSVFGIAKSFDVKLTDIYGDFLYEESYFGYAVINTDTIRVYGAADTNTTNFIELTGVKGVAIQLIAPKVTYENGVVYHYAYNGTNTQLDMLGDYFIPEDYITLTCCENCTGVIGCLCNCADCSFKNICAICGESNCKYEHLYCHEHKKFDCTEEHTTVDPEPPLTYPEIPGNVVIPEGKDTMIADANGNTVTSVQLLEGTKTSLSAWSLLGEEGTEYQWQICIDVNSDIWTAISGQTGKGILLSPATVNSIIALNGYAKIRCRITSGGTIYYTDAITVTVGSAEQTEIEKTDTATGVAISAQLPEDVELTVSPKTLAETGLDTAAYPIDGASLFYDVTLLQNGAEYQPENGITVTFPESAIADSGLEVGDYYRVYHIHDGVVDVGSAKKYDGGDVSVDFENLSVMGIAESDAPIDLISLHGGEPTKQSEYIDFTIISDKVTLYDSFENSVYTNLVEGVSGIQVSSILTITFPDGFVLYQYEYIGDNSEFKEISQTYQFISAADVTAGEVTYTPCAICGETNCTTPHLYCHECSKFDCGLTHEKEPAPAPITSPVIPNPEDVEIPEDKSTVIVDAEGNAVTSENGIQLAEGTKTSFSAWSTLGEEGTSYQWQICYDTKNDLWIDISGQTGKGILLSPAMVNSVIAMNGENTKIRCRISSGETAIYYSEAIPVSVAAEAVESASAMRFNLARSNASGVMLAAEEGGTEGETPSLTNYTVVVNYVFEDNEIVADPYTASLAAGSEFRTTVTFPTIMGYEPYITKINGEIEDEKADHIDIYIPNIQNSVEYTVTYKPTLVNYTVIHYWQKVDSANYTGKDQYEVHATDTTKQGLTERFVPEYGQENALNENYEGFYALAYEAPKIAADGSTVVEIYYDRYFYLMMFDLDGGFGTEPVYAAFGAPIGNIVSPTKPGWTFAGWSATEGDTTAVSLPTTMPYSATGKTTYYAIWSNPQTVDYTIVYWRENANDNGYSFWSQKTAQAIAGSYVNGDDNLAASATVVNGITEKNYFTYNDTLTDKNVYINGDGSSVVNVYYTRNVYTITFYYNGECKLEEHSHSDACYQLACDLQEHDHKTHGCTLTCGKSEHTHTDSCCSKSEHSEHTTECYGNAVGQTDTILNAPDNPAQGQIYYSTYYGRYYIYIGNTWYRYNSTSVDNGDIVPASSCSAGGLHTHGDGYCTYICDQEGHVHSDKCYSCEKTEHKHSNEACYKLTCGKTEHTHSNANCQYSGSSYDQNGTNGYRIFKVITAKYDAYISDEWPTATDVNQDGFQGWKIETVVNTTQTSKIVTMTYNICDNSDRVNKAYAVYNGDCTDHLYYMFESFDQNENNPENGTDRIKYNDKFYDKSIVYSQDVNSSGGSWNQKKISGMTAVGTQTKLLNGSDRYPKERNVFLYYDRVRFTFTFMSFTDQLFTTGKNVMFEQPLNDYTYNNVKLSTYNPPENYYPEGLEDDVFVFEGWYTTPECYEGTKYDFTSATMPNSDVILYANWVPIERTINFYLDENDMSDGSSSIVEDYPQLKVPHGALVSGTLEDPENGSYNFVGWFYRDENGEEKAFDFENMRVNRDMDVYAKWSSNVMKKYTVYFKVVTEKDADGNPIAEVEIADPITGSTLAGQTKTFDAKGGTDLKIGYQTGYFPLVESHSLTINIDDADNEGDNTFTFWYEPAEAVPYTVYYVAETLKNGADPNNFAKKEINGKTYYIISTTKYVEDNHNAVVTEKFETVSGYMPDAYQKRLIVVKGAVNEIVFYYTVDSVNAYYKITHWTQNTDGQNWTEYASSEAKGLINHEYTATPLTIKGFTFDETVEGTLLRGILTEDGLELNLYYVRNSYPYEVRYLEQGTGKQLADPKTGTGLYGQVISESAIVIPGYTAVDPTSQTLAIKIETSAQLNIIKFYYTENDARINYVVVGPDDCGSVTPSSETVKVMTGKALGSIAAPSENYKFVGWYSDAACNNQISADDKFVPTKQDEEVWVDGTTYYAKFELAVADLTITKKVNGGLNTSDVNQSFMFNVTGGPNNFNMTVVINGVGSVTIKDLLIGTYTVTELTDWSWRYTTDSAVKSVDLANQRSVTFTNTRINQYWLDGDSYCRNWWGGANGAIVRSNSKAAVIKD